MPDVPREQRLAETFVELADTLVDDFDVIEFLQRLAMRCVELLDVSAAGLMLADQRGELQTAAAADEHAWLLELLEGQHSEGPCPDCYRTAAPVEVADLAATDGRWPRFAAQARAAGFSTTYAVPLRLRDTVIGALNLFRRDRERLPEVEIRLAQA